MLEDVLLFRCLNSAGVWWRLLHSCVLLLLIPVFSGDARYEQLIQNLERNTHFAGAESSDMARSVCKHTRRILCLSAPLSCGACRLGDTCAGISWAPLYPDMRPFVLLCWAENLIRNSDSLQ